MPTWPRACAETSSAARDSWRGDGGGSTPLAHAARRLRRRVTIHRHVAAQRSLAGHSRRRWTRGRARQSRVALLAARGLEADLGGLALSFTGELEELARREAERAGDQGRGGLR